MVTLEHIKELREKTGISVMQCKRALEDAGGDIEKAIDLLRKKGTEIASKKSGRELHAGVITSYIHSDKKMGVLLELLVETDFVAKNSEFQTLADDIALHIAATNPQYLREEDVSDKDRIKARETFKQEVDAMDKTDDVKKKVLEGKVDTYFKENILLNQSFVKDPSKTITQLVEAAVQKIGEKIEISRFKRFMIFEE